MATAATARLVRGQPPSPPQSTDGDPAPEAHRDSCSLLPSVYGHPGAFTSAGIPESHRHGETTYDPRPSVGYTSPSQYVPATDYSRGLPMQNPMAVAGLQVNTPPPAADEGLVPDSMSQWGSPPSHKKVLKARVSRPPRVRRRSRKTRDRDLRQTLAGPLSELTKHMDSVPIKDMESHVHRSIERRHEEVVKNNGKIARPMNSFMLYRSAFAERAKTLFSQNNHQVVSEAAGDSWRLESNEIRTKYERLAHIEKINHLEAHPGYKFSPAKDKKKRTGMENGRTMVNTPDSSPALLQPRAMSSSEVDSSGWESRDSTPFDFPPEHGLSREPFLPPSSWHTATHDRSHSGIIPSSEPSQYLQQAIHPGIMPHVEDVRFKKSGLQDLHYVQSTSLAALPGGTHHDLLQPSNPIPGSGQLDPQLLNMHTELQSPTQLFGNSPYSTVWQETPGTNCYSPTTTSVAPSSVAYTAGSVYQPIPSLDNRETWDPNHEATLDGPGGEFDRWINPPGASGY
ncbi:hypothetical protein BO71DRAFT_314810 [Aspergillus ellipticus CBS 707.79]|uniref:HMG box domain-containing protein n=1 Tax=Aspergillus ellipticus CBS 707.79 TaxID=1448320 RepID=A0A319DY68_9EURO|nr:hypothetical protein BO71DRAFT_314810 [Aspergillus ellipticus CBS 707.79]